MFFYVTHLSVCLFGVHWISLLDVFSFLISGLTVKQANHRGMNQNLISFIDAGFLPCFCFLMLVWRATLEVSRNAAVRGFKRFLNGCICLFTFLQILWSCLTALWCVYTWTHQNLFQRAFLSMSRKNEALISCQEELWVSSSPGGLPVNSFHPPLSSLGLTLPEPGVF